MKFSIIIPSYNSETTILKCINSVLQQTYQDYEILLIDDASTDATVYFAREILEKSSVCYRIVEKKQNSGPGESRNIGVSIAKGDFIAFLDSDDWYTQDFLENVLKIIQKYDSDVVLSEYYKFYDNKKIIRVELPKNLSNISTKKEFIALASQSLCTMVTRGQILKGLSLPRLYNCEDAALVPLILSQAETIRLLRKPTYYYYQRQSSLSNSISTKTVESMLVAFEFIELHCNKEFSLEKEFLGIKIILYGAILNVIKSQQSKQNVFKIIDNFEHRYPLWYKNNYIKSMEIAKRIFLAFIYHRNYQVLRLLTYTHAILTKGGSK